MEPTDRRYDSYPMLADLLVKGETDVRIGATYRLDQAGDMHTALERGGNPGKTILMPSPRPHSDIPATFAALQRRPPTATTASSSP